MQTGNKVAAMKTSRREAFACARGKIKERRFPTAGADLAKSLIKSVVILS